MNHTYIIPTQPPRGKTFEEWMGHNYPTDRNICTNCGLSRSSLTILVRKWLINLDEDKEQTLFEALRCFTIEVEIVA